MATPATSRAPRTHHVRVDLIVGGGLIAVAMLGRLVSLASGTGWFDTFGIR